MVSPDGVVPSRMVGVSASVNLPLHHKVQKFSSGTSSSELSRKKGCKMVVLWYYTVQLQIFINLFLSSNKSKQKEANGQTSSNLRWQSNVTTDQSEVGLTRQNSNEVAVSHVQCSCVALCAFAACGRTSV